MDRIAHHTGYVDAFGPLGAVKYLDNIAHELSPEDDRRLRKVIVETYEMMASINFNAKERRFKIWVTTAFREKMLSRIDATQWNDPRLNTLLKNVVVTKCKMTLAGLTFRPKKTMNWHELNTQRRFKAPK